MQIQSTRLIDTGSNAASPGVLIGIQHPSPSLADAAQATLNLPERPDSVLVGIPAGLTGTSKFDDAIARASLAAAKLVSQQLARASGNQAIEHGVRVFWLGVKAVQLCNQWNDPGKNVAALMIDTTATALGALDLGLAVGGMDSEFFQDSELQEDLGLFFSTASAAAKGQDLSMAVLNRQIGATDSGKIFNVVSPILNAAISDDPAFGGVQFKPLPQLAAPG